MSEFGPKKQPGDRSLQAGAWNRLVAKNTRPDVHPPQVVNQPREYNLTQLENASGDEQYSFAALKVSGATWPERSDELFDREGMRRGVEIQGDNPSDEWQNTVISQKSSPSGSFTPGVVSGPTPCRVLFPDAASLDYPFAIPIPGDPSKLQASPYGLNRILWHAEPEAPQDGCDGRILQAYVNMGEDGQWVWFKLLTDLCPCGSAQGLLVDHCGAQIGDCPIVKTVWAPTPHDADAPVCTCDAGESLNAPPGESGGGCWMAGDILPFWWYQYLERWVTIPREQSGGAGPWSLLLAQPPQLVCEEGIDEDGNTICTGALVIPRKKLTVDGPCACLADAQSLALELPTPDLLGVPALTIETNDATGEEDDPCTCATAVLSFPVAPLAWCDGCNPDARTESVSFPVPPTDGGRFEAVQSVTMQRSTCGSVSLCTTSRGYDVVCGGLCPDPTLKNECEDIHLFDTETLEYVDSVSLDNITLDLEMAAESVVTGGSVSVSGGSASGIYQRPTGIDWTGVTFSVTLPVVSKTVVTSVSVDGCNVVGTTETIQTIDPNGTATVTMSGTPTVTTTPTSISFSISGVSATFTPQTAALSYVTGGTVSGDSLSVTTETKNVLICPGGND